MNQGNKLLDCADDWMSRTPYILNPKEPVLNAARLMTEKQVGSVLVKEKDKKNILGETPGKLLGIITDTDIVRKVVAENAPPAKTSVTNVMSGPPVVVGHNYPMFEIVRKLKNNNIKRLPVMKGEKLAGIITITDVMHALVKLGKLYDLSNLVGFIAKKEMEEPKFEHAMDVQNWMTKNPVTVRKHATILEAAQIMNKNRFGSLPVVNDYGLIVGIITDTDMVRKIVSQQVEPANSTVEGYMTRNVIIGEPDKKLAEIGELMVRHTIKRIPVVKDGKLLGIISTTDIINVLIQLNNFAEAHKIIEMMYKGNVGAW